MHLHPDYLLRIRQSVLLRPRVMRLELYFPEPRRDTDHLLIALHGTKESALRIPNYLFDAFGEVDIELIRSEQSDDLYRVLIAVTKKLTSQRLVAREQRSKLRRRMRGERGFAPEQRPNA